MKWTTPSSSAGSLLGLLVALVLTNGSVNADDGVNMCDITNFCFCDADIQPVQISCESLKLKVLYEDTDWNATLEALNVNSSEGRKLDVSFANNVIYDIPKFPKLDIVLLSFRRNHISTIAHSAFADLTSLDSLNLSYNNLTSESLFEGVFFGNFNGSVDGGYFPLPMKHLNLSHNRIHSLEKNLFDHLTSLKTIDLSHNPLTVLSGSSFQAIGSLRKLEYLGLGHVSVSSMHEGMLHDLQYLAALDLSGNEFTVVPPELRSTHALRVLCLDGNKFESLDKTSFLGLNLLEDLSIRNVNTLRTIEEETFAPLKNLSKLEISFNRRLDKISDAAFRGIVDGNKTETWPIKDFRLNDNGLTHIDQALAAWQYIDYIDIQNNPFRCDCNLDWMVTVLVDSIRRTNPVVAVDLTCAEPKEMKGQSLMSLAIEPEKFSRCQPGMNGLSLEDYDTMANNDPYRTAGVTILVIGIMLIVIGLSILGVIVVKRRAIAQALMSSSQIRYERADTEEGEFGDRKYPEVHRSSGPSSIYK